MSAPIRVAGWGTAADGSTVTWTVSEGRRGRRWREVVTRGDDVVHALLLETGSDGRFSHLELARGDGLWTFHPEGDGTLHGNHVDRTEAGVRHVEGWRFDPGDVLLIEGSTVGLAAIAYGSTGSATVGGVVVEAGGGLRREGAIAVERLAHARWRIGRDVVEVDPDGLPVLVRGERRPLERG